MNFFKKIKFMQQSNLPSITNDEELYAINVSLSDINQPKYNDKIQLSFNTTYTVGSGILANYTKGYILAGCRSRSDDSSPTLNFNGISARLMGYDGDYGSDLSGYCIFVPASTGDYFAIGSSSGSPIAWFVPAK